MEKYEIIQHHGVKGMRWGIRRAIKRSPKQKIRSRGDYEYSGLRKKARLGLTAAGASLAYSSNRSYGFSRKSSAAITGAALLGRRLLENKVINDHVANALNTKVSKLDKKDLRRIRKEVRKYQDVDIKDSDGRTISLVKDGEWQKPSRRKKKW